MPILSERLRRLSRSTVSGVSVQEVQDVLDSVCGIDLNPVAVTATRVNFVLALGNLASLGALRLPVWRADSVIVPDEAPLHAEVGPLAGVPHSQLATSLEFRFAIPAGITSAGRIARLRELIEEHILHPDTSPVSEETIGESLHRFLAEFKHEYRPGGELHSPHLDIDDEAKVAATLFQQITGLSVERRNGVWARLIENAFAPLFAGQFDVVVGNPPWLTWTRLPKGWRAQSESLWRRFGLWYTPVEAGDSFSLQSADIATLVFAVSLSRYAGPGATVGLLTPAALINADPGARAFRQFRLRPDKRDEGKFDKIDIPFRAIWVDDWSRVTPFSPDAANKPIFLVTRKGETNLSATPGAVWSRAPKSRLNSHSWRLARPSLVEALGSFTPVDPNIATSSWKFQDFSKPELIAGGTNKYTFGTGLHTRGANGIYLVDIANWQPATGNNKSTVQVTNRPGEGRNKDVVVAKGRVESELVYPILRGKDVRHWIAKPGAYILLPHDPDELDRPLESSKFLREYPKAMSWFRRQRAVLAARKPPPTRNWNMTSTGNDWVRVDGALTYMSKGHVVVVREMSSRPAAALVRKRTVMELGGLSLPPLIDHKLMLCSLPTKNEALYLVAMINSTPMQDLLESFVNSIAVSPKSMKRLPIPDWDANNSHMRDLAKLAGQISDSHAPDVDAVKHQFEMDALVIEIISAGVNYQPQPPKAKSAKKMKGSTVDTEPLFELGDG